MSTKATPELSAPNRLKLDAKGRMIPRTDAERSSAAERLRAALGRMAEIPDNDPFEPTEKFMRAIDASRPHRPLSSGTD